MYGNYPKVIKGLFGKGMERNAITGEYTLLCEIVSVPSKISYITKNKAMGSITYMNLRTIKCIERVAQIPSGKKRISNVCKLAAPANTSSVLNRSLSTFPDLDKQRSLRE